eukprot:TRINITY_DN5799_c0_g1_i2.p1 TRINITY_DN5799_c0_g1~~TRINITY_DN5799_c0_g1_i2.p1  ORF type:complete len:272 (+),score=65.27 TRINITY_DN5799_c0_g1_i2:387-1202(+)
MGDGGSVCPPSGYKETLDWIRDDATLKMAGHSHWHNIQHKKKRRDEARGNQNQKLAASIRSAVKLGGPDPKLNNLLAQQLQIARSLSYPKEKIQIAIYGTPSGEGERVLYEAKGPYGSMLIIEGVTNNRKKMAQQLRFQLSEFDGMLMGPGSLSFVFSKAGTLETKIPEDFDEDQLMELALEVEGLINVFIEDESIVYKCIPENLSQIKTDLEERGMEVTNFNINYEAENLLDLEQNHNDRWERFIDTITDIEGVTEIHHNMKITPSYDDE